MRSAGSSRRSKHDDSAEVTRRELANVREIEITRDYAPAQLMCELGHCVVRRRRDGDIIDVNGVMTAAVKRRHHLG
jgi:hypothetical protein